VSYSLSIRAIYNDLEWPEGHSPVARLLNCNSANICATFRTVLTDTARSLGDSWATCFVLWGSNLWPTDSRQRDRQTTRYQGISSSRPHIASAAMRIQHLCILTRRLQACSSCPARRCECTATGRDVSARRHYRPRSEPRRTDAGSRTPPLKHASIWGTFIYSFVCCFNYLLASKQNEIWACPDSTTANELDNAEILVAVRCIVLCYH